MDLDKKLYDTVIKNNYCIGCGACSFINNDSFEVEKNEFGQYQAKFLGGSNHSHAINVCPFSNHNDNEDKISNKIYSKLNKSNKYIGKYISCYVGHVVEGEYRIKGSSGGFGKWILNELLENKDADYVVQLISTDNKGSLFEYKIFEKGDDILQGSKSAYAPVRLDEVLEMIKNQDGTFAITALPCFSKAIRQIAKFDRDISSKVKYIIGIVCGHLKSESFAELFAWQLGVSPDKLSQIEFRGKIEGKRANEKGVYAIDEQGIKTRTQSSKELFGGDWGHGFFKYKACDYCDDIVGETTDVSVGDAWLEEYINDYLGTNILVVRNEKVNNLILDAIQDNRLEMKEISVDDVIKSQESGIRHRREGLSYRLFLKQKNNEWVPDKRVIPNNKIPEKRKKIYRLREKLRDESHVLFDEAKKKNNLQYFITGISPVVETYNKAYKNNIKSYIKYILNKIGSYNLYKRVKNKIIK